MKWYFCGITARVTSDIGIQVALFGNLPSGPQLDQAVDAAGGSQRLGCIYIDMLCYDHDLLRPLAEAIRDSEVRSAGKRAALQRQMWTRTAASLDRLALVLSGVPAA